MSRRMGVRSAVVCVVAALTALAAAVAYAGPGDKPSASEGIDDPRSGAALNREAAKDPAPPPPPIFGDDPRQLIGAFAVNNPSADATAQDTQSETSIAVDDGNVVVGFNDSGSLLGGASHFTGFARSTNSGGGFTDGGALPNSAGGDAGDPVLATNDATNRFYFATLAFNGGGIQVFRSDNAGSTWLPPVDGTASSGGSADKEWMTVDNFAGSGNGNVYLCWAEFGSGPAAIRLTRSIDNGASFSPPDGTLISNGGQGCHVVVGPDHAVYVFYYRGDGGDNKIFVRKSTDGGVTFAPEVQVADLNTTSVNGGLALNGGLRSNSFPHAAVNPVTNDMIVTWNDDPLPLGGTDRGDIFYTRSTNGGATWAAPVKVNNDGPGDQFFPTVAITPTLNRVMFGYYTRSDDPANLMFHRQGRGGVMDGATGAVSLRTNFRVGPNTPIAIGQDPVVNATYMGDYDQIDATGKYFFSSWSDNRDGNSFHAFQPDIFFARITSDSVQTPADVSVTVNAPASVDEGDTATATVSVTANGAPARDVYVNLAPVNGLTYTSASGNCDLIEGFVGCSLGGFSAGQTKSRTIGFFATESGTRTMTAKVTTSDRDTTQGNNTGSDPITVVAVPKTTQTFSTGNIAVPIPDMSTVDVPLTVGPAGTILDVDAHVRLSHTFDADLDMFLESPSGEIVELSTDNGGSGDDYGSGANDCSGTPTRFNDEAGTAITAGAAPFAGSFKPEGRLSDFDGEQQNGTWELHITDDAGSDTGTVGCFMLTIRRPS